MRLEDKIKTLAVETGYTACGLTAAVPFDGYRKAVELHRCRFPEAAALYAGPLRLADPRASAPWARSIVVCVRRYGKYAIPPGLDDHIGRNYLFDRRHAGCPDHAMPKRMKEGLRRLGLRVKVGGVPCREAAARAGVAQIARNCFSYTDADGSWINIEAWRVDAELNPDPPVTGCPCPDGCRACLDACPTGALAEPFLMRMDRCVAYLTYGAPEPIAPELADRMGPWVYGCDACQRACPLNRGKWKEIERAPWLESVADCLTPEALADMTDETFRSTVHPLFGYIPEDQLDRWRRNARRALEANRTINHPPIPNHGH